MNGYRALGFWVSLAWLLGVAVYGLFMRGVFLEMPPNEFGDFLAGALGPLGVFWIVLGFWQQGDELRSSVTALELQSRELASSVEQQKALVSVAQEQVETEKEARLEDKATEHRVARASLTYALSEIHEYSESCLKLLCYRYKSAVGGGGVSLKGPWDVPDFPYGSFRSVRDCIVGAESDLADQLSDFLGFGQIQRSRLRSKIDMFLDENSDGSQTLCDSYHLHGPITDALELLAWAERFYEYGRRNSNQASPIQDKSWAVGKLQSLRLYYNDDLSGHIGRSWKP